MIPFYYVFNGGVDMERDLNQIAINEYLQDKHLEDDRQAYKFLMWCTPYEDKYGKSFADFTREECIEMYKELGFGVTTTVNVNKALASYAEWLGKASVYSQLMPEIRRITLSKVLTKADVDKMVALMDDPCDVFISRALFNGICGHRYAEIVAAKMKDIHIDARKMDVYTATETGREYSRTVPVDLELIEAAEKCNSLERYYKESGVVRSKLYGDGIVKYRRESIVGDLPHELQSIKARLNNISKRNNRVIAGDILRSGLVYQLRVLAVQKGIQADQTIMTEEGKQILRNFGYSEKNITSSRMRRYLQ